MAFTIKGGKFSTTDDDSTIRQSPVDEVIDILTAPSRPAPVNVGMMPERRGNVNIPMGQSTFVNVPGRPDEKQVKTPLKVVSPFITKRNPVGSVDDVLFNLSLADAAGQPINYGGGEGQLSGSFTNYPGGEGYRELVQGDKVGIPSLQNVANVANISSGYPMKPDPGYEAALQKATPSGLGGIFQGILGSLTGSNPAVYMQTDEYGDPMGGGNYAVGRTFENPDTARRLGFIPVGRDAGGNIVYDVDPAITKSQEDQERSSRLDDERRERAAMLAAQQQQPVDPCPEGYRLDPVSKVCVPVDDTTQPDNIAPRTYDTMTRPEPNYTAATNFTVPTVTLPDIFS